MQHNYVVYRVLKDCLNLQVLLSNDETLQLSGVQCVADVLSHHPQYGQTLLQADIAG